MRRLACLDSVVGGSAPFSRKDSYLAPPAIVRETDVNLRAAFRALLFTYRAHWKFLTFGYLAAAILCLVAAWDGGLYYFLDFRAGGGRFAGLMTVASSFCLLAAGVLLMVVGREIARRKGWGAEAVGWIAAGVGTAFLAFDELVQIHEPATRWLGRHGIPKLFGTFDQDVYIFGFYGLSALVTARLVYPELRRQLHTWFPFLAAIGFFVASECVDMVPWLSLNASEQKLFGPLEEGLKSMGSASLLLFGILLVEAMLREKPK